MVIFRFLFQNLFVFSLPLAKFLPLALKNGTFLVLIPGFHFVSCLLPVKNGTLLRCFPDVVCLSMKGNDMNKSKFFKAERECFPDIWTTEPDFRTTKECQDYINQALHDPVFLRYYPEAKEIEVLIRPGRGARRINWWFEDNSAAVPKAFRRKYLLLHTAAHFLQPPDAPKHGYGFLKTYFTLLHRELGKTPLEALKKALKANGVSYRKPRKGSDSPEFLQMLRERMQAINALRPK